MVALNRMKARTKVLDVPWDGETVQVSYFPNVVTPELLEEVTAAAEEENLNVLSVMLEPTLDWWDITESEEEGSPRLPTDKATIRAMPMSFLNALQKSIQDAQNPPDSGDSASTS